MLRQHRADGRVLHGADFFVISMQESPEVMRERKNLKSGGKNNVQKNKLIAII